MLFNESENSIKLFDCSRSVVRLGEHNMETEIDCDGDLCAPQPQDIEPSKIIIHEKYNSPLFKHDIALIRLSAQVQLNGKIK